MSHVVNNNKNDGNILKLPIVKLDSFDLVINIQDIKLMLIDVEWHEYETLQGMEETLKKLQDVDIIVEVFENGQSGNNVITFMKKLWFDYRKIDVTEYLFHKPKK